MSQAAGLENINKFEVWMDSVKENDWVLFKNYEYRGELSKGKVSKACSVDVQAFKPDGNALLITKFNNLDIELQSRFPDVFKQKGSSKDRYKAFVDGLSKAGGKFPTNADGDLDYKIVAKKCGITLASLTSPSIASLLKKDVSRLGTENTAGQTVEARMDEHLQSTSSELNRCRKDLAIAQELIEGLKKQVLNLERENRQVKLQSTEQQESLAHIVETGRRFTL
jgi:hypothetical protein